MWPTFEPVDHDADATDALNYFLVNSDWKSGAENISYCVVQTGAKIATWDPPSENRVKKGDLFLMDLSATYNGYHADITRPTVVGEPSEKQKKAHRVVLDAQLKAIDAVRDGVKAGVVQDRLYVDRLSLHMGTCAPHRTRCPIFCLGQGICCDE